MARLDAELVRRGLARSRGEARELIDAGLVFIDDQPAHKPARPVTSATQLTVDASRPRWVGRAAYKLDHALTRWEPEGLDVAGARCLDVGASTGGFTQVLLARGAEHVVALDVGHHQLVPEIAQDPRVTDLSGTSIRDVCVDDIGTFDVVVADLSFISLTLVVAQIATLIRSGADVVLLVKPQFEVGRGRLGKNGVVTAAALRADAIAHVIAAATDVGLHPCALARSPIVGTEGNAEYLLWVRPKGSGTMDPDRVTEAIAAVTEEDQR